jgi:uncharacterized membrane protein
MISSGSLITIFGMSATTYATRVGGFLLLRGRQPSPKAKALLSVAPGCVLISAIAPHFISPHPAELIALAITIFAATRFSMLPTVLSGVASLALLHILLGS